jgi:hypothetical protein
MASLSSTLPVAPSPSSSCGRLSGLSDDLFLSMASYLNGSSLAQLSCTCRWMVSTLHDDGRATRRGEANGSQLWSMICYREHQLEWCVPGVLTWKQCAAERTRSPNAVPPLPPSLLYHLTYLHMAYVSTIPLNSCYVPT